MNATGAGVGDMSSSSSSSYVPGRPKRQTYRRANTDRIASAAAAASSYAPDPIYDSSSAASLGAAAAAEDPYVSCATGILDRFGSGGGTGNFGAGYYELVARRCFCPDII